MIESQDPEMVFRVRGGWRVVDKWWLPEPVQRLWVELEAPDGSVCAIGYDMSTKTWSLKEREED